MASQPPDCVFCKISDGQIPALRVLETDHALAFLDIGPLAEGHVLLIPRAHYARIDDMPSDRVSEVTRLLPELARAVMRVTGAVGYNILQNNGRVAGQCVDHVHFHIIPRQEDDGLGYRWNPKSYESGRGEAIRQQLLRVLGESRRDH